MGEILSTRVTFNMVTTVRFVNIKKKIKHTIFVEIYLLEFCEEEFMTMP